MRSIWSEYIPGSGEDVSGMNVLLERYGERFNPDTGLGGFQILIPVSESAPPRTENSPGARS
jgi:hypothetical protein